MNWLSLSLCIRTYIRMPTASNLRSLKLFESSIHNLNLNLEYFSILSIVPFSTNRSRLSRLCLFRIALPCRLVSKLFLGASNGHVHCLFFILFVFFSLILYFSSLRRYTTDPYRAVFESTLGASRLVAATNSQRFSSDNVRCTLQPHYQSGLLPLQSCFFKQATKTGGP